MMQEQLGAVGGLQRGERIHFASSCSLVIDQNDGKALDQD